MMTQRWLFLTHHARILLYHPGVGYLHPPPQPSCCACANVIPHPELLSYDNSNHIHNNNTAQ